MHCWKHQMQLNIQRASVKDSDITYTPKTGTVTFRKEPSLPLALLFSVLTVLEMPSVHVVFTLQY